MTDPADDEPRDGFGVPLSEQLPEGFAMVLMYGAAPSDFPDNPFTPHLAPPGDRVALTAVSGLSTLLSLDLSESEWQAVRAAIFRALQR